VVFTATGTLADWSHWDNTPILTLPAGVTDSSPDNNGQPVVVYQLLIQMIFR